MAVQFCSKTFVASHGKQPRGWGRWAFFPNNSDQPLFSPAMNFADAKAWAKQQRPDVKLFEVGS